MKKFNKDALTLFIHFGNAGSLDFTIPVFEQMNRRRVDFQVSEERQVYEDYLLEGTDFIAYNAMKDISVGKASSRILGYHGRNFPLTPDNIFRMFGDINLLSNCRDPINRVLSQMSYSIGTFKTLNKNNIRNFIPGYGNMYIRRLLKWHLNYTGIITRDQYIEAVDIIEKNYFLVMLTDHFAESLYLKAMYLGLDTSSLDYVLELYRPNAIRKTGLPDIILDVLAEKNSYDIMLYEYLKKNLLNQLEELTDMQKAELHEFKARNDAVVQKQKLISATDFQIRASFDAKSYYFSLYPLFKMTGTKKTIEFFENQYPGFFKILEESLSDGVVKAKPHVYDNYLEIARKLEVNSEYIIIGADEQAYRLSRSIDKYNRDKKANITLLYMLSNDQASNERKVRNIPVYPFDVGRVRGKNIIISDFVEYFNVREGLLAMGVDECNIVDRLGDDGLQSGDTKILTFLAERGVYSRKHCNLYHVYGASLKEVINRMKVLIESRGEKCIIVNHEELLNTFAADEGPYIESEADILRNAKLAGIMKDQSDVVICTSDKMYNRVREYYYQNFPDYFEVDLNNEAYSGYDPYDLAFIIIVESTEFCRKLRAEIHVVG